MSPVFFEYVNIAEISNRRKIRNHARDANLFFADIQSKTKQILYSLTHGFLQNIQTPIRLRRKKFVDRIGIKLTPICGYKELIFLYCNILHGICQLGNGLHHKLLLVSFSIFINPSFFLTEISSCV